MGFGGGAVNFGGWGGRSGYSHKPKPVKAPEEIERVVGAYRKVGLHNRLLYRRSRHTQFQTRYFAGRRFYHYWGSHVGFYSSIPWYDTAEFRKKVKQKGEPTVRPRKLEVKVIPYEVSEVHIPITATGKTCKVSHPHGSTRYLLEMNEHVGPGKKVKVFLPPSEVPRTKGRVDILTSLKTHHSFTQHVVDTTGDGVPDASPMVADRDAYIAVVAQRGVADSLRVYVPDTPLLLLKHVVDAIESWGEQALVDRAKISRNGRVDSDFIVDVVQLGLQENGFRWEHEEFVDPAKRSAPQVVTVEIPPGRKPGSLFFVGAKSTGAKEAIYVRVPHGAQGGDLMDVMIPEQCPHTTKQKLNDENPRKTFWAVPAGVRFLEEVRARDGRLTVGALEVTVKLPTIADLKRYAGCCGCCKFLSPRAKSCYTVLGVFLTFAITIGVVWAAVLGSSSSSGSGSSNASTYTNQWCSSYFGLSKSCEECPTKPSGIPVLVCWEDSHVTWDYMERYLGDATDNWADLGYNEFRWDTFQIPAAANKCWYELSSVERAAATNLGFTSQYWDFPYHC